MKDSKFENHKLVRKILFLVDDGFMGFKVEKNADLQVICILYNLFMQKVENIEGAKNAGYHAVLVQTGKYRKALVAQSQIKPSGIISSIDALPGYLSSLIKQ